MTDKEFKRLSRSQLIDIIYQLQLKNKKLTDENEELSKELADKRFRVSTAGSIAEAALEVHNVMQAAQNAAEHYLEEIRNMRGETEAECQHLLENARKDAEEECRRLLERAQQEADNIIAQAKRNHPSDTELEEIIKEFG